MIKESRYTATKICKVKKEGSKRGKQGRNDLQKSAINKTAIEISNLSIIDLIVNELNSPIKSPRMSEWIKQQDPITHCLQEADLSFMDTQRLRVKVWEKIF